MKRVLLITGILILALGPVGASGQGLLGDYWSGLSASLLGGSWSCGPKVNSPVLYVGYTYDPGNSTGLKAETRDGSVWNINALSQQYGMRGVWLGLSQTVPVTERFGVIASGWYLVPSATSDSQELYNSGSAQQRLWSSLKTEWWYADALGAFGSLNGFSLLGGFRYDSFSTKLGSPIHSAGVGSQPSDKADVASKGYIPLLGAQMAYAGANYSLLLRVIGCPVLIGRVRYAESGGDSASIDASGNYKGTNFLEFFSEYGHRMTERTSIGLFARFSATRGASNLTVDGHPAGNGAEPFSVSIGRNSWTAGGRFTMEF